MNAEFTRRELYDLVWSQPMKTIAAEVGISDVALAKQCKKADIPVPNRGYWAQKQAGKPTNPGRLATSLSRWLRSSRWRLASPLLLRLGLGGGIHKDADPAAPQ